MLEALDVTYVDNWGPECTHLTVNKMAVTSKVLHAILDAKPITLTDYWTHFLENVLINRAPPNIEDFCNPPSEEPLLNNINFTNTFRKSLFANKIFVFPTDKSKSDMEVIIRKAG